MLAHMTALMHTSHRIQYPPSPATAMALTTAVWQSFATPRVNVLCPTPWQREGQNCCCFLGPGLRRSVVIGSFDSVML